MPRPAWVSLLSLAILAAVPPAASAEDRAAATRDVRAWQTGAFAPDRLQHVSLSLTLGLGAGIATARPAAALGTALGLGVAKELRDRRHGRFDPGDLVADAAGAALAAILTRAISR